MTIFNPLYATVAPDTSESNVSVSSLVNDVVGVCPKCKQPFGTGVVLDDTVYYCDRCRVSQPIPN